MKYHKNDTIESNDCLIKIIMDAILVTELLCVVCSACHMFRM